MLSDIVFWRIAEWLKDEFSAFYFLKRHPPQILSFKLPWIIVYEKHL